MRISISPHMIKLHGYETGKLSVVKQTRNAIVLKEKGHTYWAGLNMARSYAPAKTRVFTITREIEPNYFEVEELVQY